MFTATFYPLPLALATFISLNNSYFTGGSTGGLVGSPKNETDLWASQIHFSGNSSRMGEWLGERAAWKPGSQLVGKTSNCRKDFWMKTNKCIIIQDFTCSGTQLASLGSERQIFLGHYCISTPDVRWFPGEERKSSEKKWNLHLRI